MNPYKTKCLSCAKRPTCGGTGVACGSCSSMKGLGSVAAAGGIGLVGVAIGVGMAALGGYGQGWVGAKVFGPKAQTKTIAATSAKGSALIAAVLGGIGLLLGTALMAGRAASNGTTTVVAS